MYSKGDELATALSSENLLYCFIGVALGMIVGVLPGIGALTAISMPFPIIFSTAEVYRDLAWQRFSP